MNSNKSVGFVRRFLTSAALLMVATVAGAQEMRQLRGAERGVPFEGATPQKFVFRAERVGEGTPLLIAVPKLTGTKEIVVEVLLGEQTLVRETIQLDGDVAERSAVRLLGNQSADLEKLRRIAAARANELLVRITAGEREITRGRFHDFDAASAGLVGTATAVGATRVVDVEMKLRRNSDNITSNGYEPDPQCEAQCYEEYDFCMVYICDPRGSCSQCEQWLDDCLYSCPRVCVDPKDVDEFVRTVYLGSEYFGVQCLNDPRDNQAYYWDVWRDYYREETVRRTEYCNGTYSEQVLSYYNWYKWCYDRMGWCVFANGTAPSSQICG